METAHVQVTDAAVRIAGLGFVGLTCAGLGWPDVLGLCWGWLACVRWSYVAGDEC